MEGTAAAGRTEEWQAAVQEAVQDGWHSSCRENGEWQAAVDTRPMRHSSPRYTNTAWTLLSKTELRGLWTSLTLERPSCLTFVLNTG